MAVVVAVSGDRLAHIEEGARARAARGPEDDALAADLRLLQGDWPGGERWRAAERVREALERLREERDAAWFEERRGVDAAGNPTVSVWCRRCGVEHQRPEHCPARPESAEAEVRQLREQRDKARRDRARFYLEVRRLTEGLREIEALYSDPNEEFLADSVYTKARALLSASPSDGPDDFCEHGYTTENAAHPSAGLERCPTCSPTDGGGA